MRLTARGKGFLVYDEVLETEAFQKIWLYMQRTQYCWVHAQGWLKAWRLTDGMPLGGPVSYSDKAAVKALNPPGWLPPAWLLLPHGAAYRRAAGSDLDQASRLESLDR